MKKFLGYLFLLAFMFGGWTLAAASLHVVRTPATSKYIPVNLHFVTKNHLTFKDTWVDTTKWNLADLSSHEEFAARLAQAGQLDLVKDLPAPAPVTRNDAKEIAPSTSDPKKAEPSKTGEKKPTSIFDF